VLPKYGEFFFDVFRLNFNWTCLLNLSSAHHSLTDKWLLCCVSETPWAPFYQKCYTIQNAAHHINCSLKLRKHHPDSERPQITDSKVLCSLICDVILEWQGLSSCVGQFPSPITWQARQTWRGSGSMVWLPCLSIRATQVGLTVNLGTFVLKMSLLFSGSAFCAVVCSL
jgi:hypothetical protein